MKFKKFRPKRSEEGTLIGSTVVYCPTTPPLESAARDQRSLDTYDPSVEMDKGMREFYAIQKSKHEALAACVGKSGTIKGFFGQGRSWPPLFLVEFPDGLQATLGNADLGIPA